jgi:GTPase Era involved in 16S rRNA processing
MTEITLKYNPFEAKVSYQYNGKNKSVPKCIGVTGEKSRLQDWLYDFFPNLKEMHNWGEGSECRVSFGGTRGDFEDLEHTCDIFKKDNPGIQITLNHSNSESKSLTYRLSYLEKIFKNMQDESPYEELKDPALKPSFERVLNSEFEISVIATMSSGKSTLINALLGQEILPARNEATTAKIAQIRDVDGAKDFTVKGLKKNDDGGYREATEEKPATLAELEELNKSDSIDKIEIIGDIPGIHSREIRLLLSDTPGPNNSRTIDHAKHIDDLIKADYKPMIMYILNTEQLEINDDKSLLEKISKAMSGSSKQATDRFLFVLNKADRLDPDKNEFVEKKIADCRDYLQGFGITGARIFPVSAQLAKVIRMSQAGRPLTEDEEDFLAKKDRFIKRKERHLSDYASLSPSCKKKQEEILRDAEASNDKNTQALVYSGIIALELAMDEYLEKYALPAKISDAVGVFKSIVDRLDLKNNTEKELAENEDARKEVEANLKALRGKIENGSEAMKFKEKFDRDINTIENKLEIDFKRYETTVYRLSDEEHKKYYHNDGISPTQAKNIISATQKNMQLQYEILSSDLAILFDRELRGQAQNYLAEYQKYISGLMKTEGYTLSAALNLIKVAIPDSVDDLIDRFSGTKEVTERVHRSEVNRNKSWWNPFTWFSPKNLEWEEESKRDVVFVKMEPFYRESINPLFLQFISMIDNARKAAKENAQGLKNFFTKEIDRLDQILKETIQKEEEDVKSQERIKQKIKENKVKAEWLSAFIAELEKVLEV